MSGIRRVLIVGVSSHIGSALAVGLRDHFEVFGTYFSNPLRMDGVTAMRLDLTNGGDALEAIKRSQPDVVLFCAGIHDRLKAESQRALAEAINLKAATLFFKIQNNPAHFVYFSMDEVAGRQSSDDKGLIEESANCEPLNALGWTKWQGENTTLSVRKKTHVLRLGALFGENGGSLHRPKRSWIWEFLRRLELQQSVPASTEVYRSPLFLGDLVRAVSLFLTNLPEDSGLWHLASSTCVSEFEMFESVAKALMPGRENLIRPVGAVSLSTSGVVRPAFAALSSKKFSETYAYEFKSLEHSLAELRERLRTGHLMAWDLNSTPQATP